jgi:hypothetical protein
VEVSLQGVRLFARLNIPLADCTATIEIAVTDSLSKTEPFWFTVKRAFLFFFHPMPPSCNSDTGFKVQVLLSERKARVSIDHGPAKFLLLRQPGYPRDLPRQIY